MPIGRDPDLRGDDPHAAARQAEEQAMAEVVAATQRLKEELAAAAAGAAHSVVNPQRVRPYDLSEIDYSDDGLAGIPDDWDLNDLLNQPGVELVEANLPLDERAGMFAEVAGRMSPDEFAALAVVREDTQRDWDTTAADIEALPELPAESASAASGVSDAMTKLQRAQEAVARRQEPTQQDQEVPPATQQLQNPELDL